MQALTLAMQYERDIIAERRIQGREVTVSVLGGRVLPAVEIVPHEGFYDYANKYQAGAVEELCPARIALAEASALADADQPAPACCGGNRNGLPFAVRGNTPAGDRNTGIRRAPPVLDRRRRCVRHGQVKR